MVCTKQVYEDPTIYQLTCSSVRRRTTCTSGPKRPYLAGFLGLGLLLGVGTETSTARTTRNFPWRMNASPEQETSIIYVTYEHSKAHASYVHTTRHYNYLARRAGPCSEAMPTRGRGEARQSQRGAPSAGGRSVRIARNTAGTRQYCEYGKFTHERMW